MATFPISKLLTAPYRELDETEVQAFQGRSAEAGISEEFEHIDDYGCLHTLYIVRDIGCDTVRFEVFDATTHQTVALGTLCFQTCLKSRI